MTQQTPGTSRLTRTAAKEVPRRSADRLFSAKSAAKTMCENLMHDIRRAPLHDADRKDFAAAVERALHLLQQISVDADHASNTVRDLTKELQHLQVAQTWIAAATRVQNRLGNHGPKAVHEQLSQAHEQVMWHIRAGLWDGQLTSTVLLLEHAVKQAETHAAHVAS